MSRNFSNESFANALLRTLRAASGRLRGRVFYTVGFFAKGSASSLYFGFGPRFINSKGVMLGSQVSFGILARIEAHGTTQSRPLITVGDRTSFGDYAHIGASQGIKIGNGVLGGSNILIVDHSHGSPKMDMKTRTDVIPRDRPLSSKGPIEIGDGVWIGDNAVILSGSTIGKGAIIAANAVVDCEVPPHTIHFRSMPKQLKS